MTIPRWMPTPSLPSARESYGSGAKVIDQRPGPNHTILVTFALPGLQRAVITVPESEWMEGNHLPIGSHLAQRFTPTGYNDGNKASPRHG